MLYLTYPQPYGSELSVDVKCGFWSSRFLSGSNQLTTMLRSSELIVQDIAFCGLRILGKTALNATLHGESSVCLHHGKIEDAVVKAVVQDDDGIKLQVDVVGLDLTALIDTRQVVE